MKTYCPLFSSILDSTLWSESKETRILFLTMLAMKDLNGMVESTTAGLARRANITFEEAIEAVRILESPDTKTDKPQEFEGRRIERNETGWLVLNHFKYRDMIGKVKRRDQQAKWQRDYRAKKKSKPLPGENLYVKTLNKHGQEAADKL